MNHLLILDDDSKFGDFVGEVAATESFEVSTCTTVTAFRSSLDLFKPSVILLDLMMPGIDGIEVLRELAERQCRSDILIASGIDLRTLNTAQKIGLDMGLEIKDVISKPIRVAELRAILEKVRKTEEPLNSSVLERAITEDQLFLTYQPKIEFISNEFKGVEALVRWRHPDGHIVYPDHFIEEMERENLANKLTNWVLENALRQMSAWKTEGLDLQLSVNLSASNLQDLTLPNRIADLCEILNVETSKLTLELTETATMEDVSMMMEIATRLRLKNFNLSIDDFGTGYSSMIQLQRLPFSELKIDKSFVMPLAQSQESKVFVRAMINLAHNLGLSVVAEGVEDMPANDFLSTENCGMAQGFHISRPVEAEALDDFRQNWMSAANSAGAEQPLN